VSYDEEANECWLLLFGEQMKLFDTAVIIIFLGLLAMSLDMWVNYDKLQNKILAQKETIDRLLKEANDYQIENDNLHYQFNACKLLYRGV